MENLDYRFKIGEKKLNIDYPEELIELRLDIFENQKMGIYQSFKMSLEIAINILEKLNQMFNLTINPLNKIMVTVESMENISDYLILSSSFKEFLNKICNYQEENYKIITVFITNNIFFNQLEIINNLEKNKNFKIIVMTDYEDIKLVIKENNKIFNDLETILKDLNITTLK